MSCHDKDVHRERDSNLDELFFSEIQRRRERDFSYDSVHSSSSSYLQLEEESDNDWECDSLCTESEVDSHTRNLASGISSDSESENVGENEDCCEETGLFYQYSWSKLHFFHLCCMFRFLL